MCGMAVIISALVCGTAALLSFPVASQVTHRRNSNSTSFGKAVLHHEYTFGVSTVQLNFGAISTQLAMMPSYQNKP